ncbi:hypothetical protein [Bordetella bronchiseptica]|uniref:hypothetical protein n=1 Tax=Bordetella bronchiseptica TaxID=518 RepID=UPI000F6C75C1|nr:hypothetical protein [Bordetella bronchiseptica]VEI25152.1 phage protein [Bordetella bronchiseptica]
MSQRIEAVGARSLGDLVVSELRLLYGSKFAQAWEGLTPREVKASWGEKLAGLTEAEARVGLVACLGRDWPPTLPEFIRLCRPWMDPEVAFHEAVAGMAARKRGEMGAWSHPAVFHAARSVGTHDLLNCGYSVMRSRWERAFRDELARGQWGPVPMPAPALPAPGATRATPEEAAEAMAKMGAGGVLAQGGRDPRRGWRRVLAEMKDPKGRRYSPAIVAMARNALGISEGSEA